MTTSFAAAVAAFRASNAAIPVADDEDAMDAAVAAESAALRALATTPALDWDDIAAKLEIAAGRCRDDSPNAASMLLQSAMEDMAALAA